MNRTQWRERERERLNRTQAPLLLFQPRRGGSERRRKTKGDCCCDDDGDDGHADVGDDTFQRSPIGTTDKNEENE